MSKLYNEYLKLKRINKEKVYLIKNGKFFIFIEEDAKRINQELGLKLIELTKGIEKCGFPVTELDKYLKFLTILNIDNEVIYLGKDFVLNDLKKLKVISLSKKEMREKLIYYQNILKEEKDEYK